ncbi:hypothetical protein V6Z12_A11G260800 [Gossypium hirsutum]
MPGTSTREQRTISAIQLLLLVRVLLIMVQCQMCDLYTRKVLLLGSVHHGLYRLSLQNNC